MKTISEIRKSLEGLKLRGAWSNGVHEYAMDILENLEGEGWTVTENNALNGASDWHQYAAGGNGLVYNSSIAARLCNPSEFRKCKGGQLAPNSRETWIDVEARALFQAWRLIAANL